MLESVQDACRLGLECALSSVVLWQVGGGMLESAQDACRLGVDCALSSVLLWQVESGMLESVQVACRPDVDCPLSFVVIWQVESGMLESVQDACRLGVESYGGRPREAWVLEWPGQVVLVGSAIFWTAEVSASLSSKDTGKLAPCLHMSHCRDF